MDFREVGNRWRIPEDQILSLLSDSGGDVDLVWLEADLGEDLPEYDWGTEQPDILPVALNEHGALMVFDLAEGK